MNLTKTDCLGIALFLSLGSCVIQAKAEVRLGSGVNCGVSVDGNWAQEGVPYDREECGQALSLQYIGQTSLPWLDYMAGLVYRKGSSVSGEWLTDDCYHARQYHGGRPMSWFAPNVPECDHRFKTSLVETTSQGVMFALVPTYHEKDWSLYTSLGLNYVQSVTEIEWAGVSWPTGSIGQGTTTVEYKTNNLAPYMDFGATYKNLFVTVYYTPKSGAESPDMGSYGVIAGLKF